MLNYSKRTTLRGRVFSHYIISYNMFNFFKSKTVVSFFKFFFFISNIFKYFDNCGGAYDVVRSSSLNFLFMRISNHFYIKVINARLFIKYLIFYNLKSFIINYFLVIRGGIQSMLMLNFLTPLRHTHFSIKNFFFNLSTHLTLYKKEQPGSPILNFNILKNVRLLDTLSIYKPHGYNIKQHGYLVEALSCGLTLSLFSLWNFFLFLPLNTTGLALLPSISNVYNLFVKGSLANNVILSKYLNISNYDFMRFNRTHISFFKRLRRKVFRFVDDLHFSDTLVRLVESVSKMKTLIFVNRSLKQQLSFYEWVRFDLFRRRFQSSSRFKLLKLNTRFLQSSSEFFYRRRRSQNFYWFELSLVCFLLYKTRDTMLLITFLYNKMRRMSLFKHRFFLRRMFFILRVLFYEMGDAYSIVGIRLRISGKISVTGNSRTRTIHFKEGIVSNSNMTTRVDHNYTIIKTNTGCLGLSIWLFF